MDDFLETKLYYDLIEDYEEAKVNKQKKFADNSNFIREQLRLKQEDRKHKESDFWLNVKKKRIKKDLTRFNEYTKCISNLIYEVSNYKLETPIIKKFRKVIESDLIQLDLDSVLTSEEKTDFKKLVNKADNDFSNDNDFKELAKKAESIVHKYYDDSKYLCRSNRKEITYLSLIKEIKAEHFRASAQKGLKYFHFRGNTKKTNDINMHLKSNNRKILESLEAMINNDKYKLPTIIIKNFDKISEAITLLDYEKHNINIIRSAKDDFRSLSSDLYINEYKSMILPLVNKLDNFIIKRKNKIEKLEKYVNKYDLNGQVVQTSINEYNKDLNAKAEYERLSNKLFKLYYQLEVAENQRNKVLRLELERTINGIINDHKNLDLPYNDIKSEAYTKFQNELIYKKLEEEKNTVIDMSDYRIESLYENLEKAKKDNHEKQIEHIEKCIKNHFLNEATKITVDFSPSFNGYTEKNGDIYPIIDNKEYNNLIKRNAETLRREHEEKQKKDKKVEVKPTLSEKPFFANTEVNDKVKQYFLYKIDYNKNPEEYGEPLSMAQFFELIGSRNLESYANLAGHNVKDFEEIMEQKYNNYISEEDNISKEDGGLSAKKL